MRRYSPMQGALRQLIPLLQVVYSAACPPRVTVLAMALTLPKSATLTLAQSLRVTRKQDAWTCNLMIATRITGYLEITQTTLEAITRFALVVRFKPTRR